MKYFSQIMICLILSFYSWSSDLNGYDSLEKAKEKSRKIEKKCKYDLVIASVFQNEARFLKEWIEYHRLIGVQRFILFNDKSTDDYLHVLKPYIKKKIVKLYETPSPDNITRWTDFQKGIVKKAVALLSGKSRWVAFIDIDEFIVPMENDNLLDCLKAYEQYGGVYVRWENFGTSYVKRVPEDRLLIETLLLRRNFEIGHKMLGKHIFKPHCVKYPNIHRSVLTPPWKTIDMNPDALFEDPPLKIHHYFCRDEDFLVEVKKERCQRVKGWDWSKRNFDSYFHIYNEIADFTMLRFADKLRNRVLK